MLTLLLGDIVYPICDIVEHLITQSYTIFYTVSAYRISYAISYYDIVDSELRYRSVDKGCRMYRKSYRISYTRYRMSKVRYFSLGPT